MSGSQAAAELKRVRVVVVSPGDVAAERDLLEQVVAELNHGVAKDRGCVLSLWRWEVDAYAGMHLDGPQGLIDEAMAIEDADVVVGIFWRRFGTPTHDAQSGTEHELRKAWAAWREHRRPDVKLYFCRRPHEPPETAAESEQQTRVIRFRDTMPEQQLWFAYVQEVEFERLVRDHPTTFMLARDAGAAAGSAARPVKRVRFNLPLQAAHFTGRADELKAIDAALGVADRAVVTQAITGLGGVGKSRLASRYAHEHAGDYDVVAWIRAEDGGIADLAELAAVLELAVAQLAPVERAQVALRWLQSCDERWLLVLDNVAEPAQLRDCCPSTGNGRVLVTSRHRGLARLAPALALDVFDEPTAVDYLVAEVNRSADRDGARRLARALGRLPLALAHAGAYCAGGTSFDDYRALLGELPAAELFDERPDAFYEQTVASTWQLSIAAAERAAPLARAALELAANLGPDAIPRALFAVLLDDRGAARERKRLGDALNALHRLSLAEVDGDVVSVHRLLQKVVRDEAGARGDASAARRALAALRRELPSDPSSTATWPASERLLSHVLALSEILAEPGDAGEQLVELLNRATLYLIWADAGRRAADVARAVAERADAILGPEHAATLTARENMAHAVRVVGGTAEATAVQERLLADRERILGPEHPATRISADNLAACQRAMGREDDADAVERGGRPAGAPPDEGA